jgi:hypothetical protein
MRLLNPFRRRPAPVRRGSSVARGSMLASEGGFADRLRQLGVPHHDPLGDALGAGMFGRLSRGGGGSHPDLVAGDELPPGSKVIRAPSVVERMQGDDDGTVWNGPEKEKP